jgi:hypothetical protein
VAMVVAIRIFPSAVTGQVSSLHIIACMFTLWA